MRLLRGLGRAMTALGQDLSFTKREDEERQRKAAAAEAEAEQQRLAGRAAVGMRSGALEPGTSGYNTAIDAISTAGGNPVSAMAPVPEPDRFYAPVRTGAGYAQGSESGDWRMAPDGFVPPPDDPRYISQAGELGSVEGNVWAGVEGAPVAEPRTTAPPRGIAVTNADGTVTIVDPTIMGDVEGVRKRVPGETGYNPNNILGLGALGGFKTLAEWVTMTLAQQQQWVRDNPDLAAEQQDRLRREQAGN